MLSKYIIRRILVFIPMLLLLTIIIFILAKAAPGDPFTGKAPNPNIDPEVYEQQREALGLNDPLPVQYLDWLGSFVTGDFGESIYYNGRSVIDLIYVFSIHFGLFPAQGSLSGAGQQGLTLFVDRLHHLILPGFTLGLAGIATYMRYMRSEVMDVLKSDYIRTAKAKGMGEANILYKHTLRNALIPIITLMGFEFGVLLSGAVITEEVFNYPGLGSLFIDSITNRDYPVIMAINLLLGTTILLGNLIADILYSIVDPRIRYD